jgi:hypothetical protein
MKIGIVLLLLMIGCLGFYALVIWIFSQIT